MIFARKTDGTGGNPFSETVAAASGSRETPVWCMVYHGLDYQQEARIFANQQKYVKGLFANMLRGVARFIVSYGELMKDDVFCDRLGKVSAREITRNAKEKREGSLGFTEAILAVYNKKTSGGLRDAAIKREGGRFLTW